MFHGNWGEIRQCLANRVSSLCLHAWPRLERYVNEWSAMDKYCHFLKENSWFESLPRFWYWLNKFWKRGWLCGDLRIKVRKWFWSEHECIILERGKRKIWSLSHNVVSFMEMQMWKYYVRKTRAIDIPWEHVTRDRQT